MWRNAPEPSGSERLLPLRAATCRLVRVVRRGRSEEASLLQPSLRGVVRKRSVMAWFVEVVDFDTNEVVKRLGPMSMNRAVLIDQGLTHNLNHARFFTRIVEEVEKP